ncbi:EF-hand domain-containing protein [Actinosynnema sp. NPDC053489]|uniref:EF-hand domain-containing protein n=1 Tax=Actinosynnema sp. NPDC053489 TaxID=3363916 RepID=UPI0037CAC9E2
MTSDLKQRKYDKVFERIDADHDGRIDQSDITAMAEAWCQALGAAPGSPEATRLTKLASDMWKGVQQHADLDVDAAITRDEWATASEDPGFVDNVAVPFALAAFDAADRDDDGRISREEMAAAQTRSGMSESESRAAFEKLDVDHDGYVSREEFARAVKEFYLSEDPSATGTELAGSL